MTSLAIFRATEFGRREPQEPAPFERLVRSGEDRVIVAELTETTVSRKHFRIEPLTGSRALVRNESSKSALALSGGLRLAPGESRETTLPLGCEIGNKVLRFEAATTEELKLQSLNAPTLAPGQAPRDYSSLRLKDASETGTAGLTEGELLAWLQASMEVFQSASGSTDFLPKAAQAAAQLIRLDTVGVLLRQDERWDIATLSGREGAAVSVAWRPSQTMLRRVLNERRTFFHVPEQEPQFAHSLIGVQSLVAAPILNRGGEIIGVLYGERSAGGIGGELRELEVKLFELLAYGVAAGLARVEQERKLIAERIRFEQFFSPELARMLEIRGEAMLAPRDAEITVLFCDIKGFSRISAQNGAEIAVEWVRDVLSAVSDCVAEHQGVLIDYSGDALEAIWGAPLDVANHAEQACRAALHMRAVLPELNSRWKSRLGEATDVAIGINTGRAQVGNIGSRRKFKYGAFGTTVNLASRVQGATKHVGVSLLATKSVVERLPDSFARRRLCTVRTVNIEQPVELFELVAEANTAWAELKTQYETALGSFERGDSNAARELLTSLIAAYPQDEPARKLLNRASAAIPDPQSSTDSVWVLDGK
jgi:adenylate cyclase